MNGRLEMDYDGLEADIGAILDELRAIRLDGRFAQFVGEGAKRVREWEALMRRRMGEPFHTVVVGDFKRGKSTLINALLGVSAVPTDVLPETVTINRISYGEGPSCMAVLKNGKKARLNVRELKRERLLEAMSGLPSSIEYIDIRERCELLKSMMVVDTPGIGDLFREFDEQVAGYLDHADALVYVVSARSPLSYTELEFLNTAVMPRGFSRVFVVVNMIDCVEEAGDMERVVALARDKVRTVLPDAEVYAVSALDEYCRLMGLPRPLPDCQEHLEDRFAMFRDAVERDIVMQKGVIRSMRLVSLCVRMLDDIGGQIRLLAKAVNMGAQELESQEAQYLDEGSERMEDIRRKLADTKLRVDAMCQEAIRWMAGFMGRLKHEVQAIRDKAETDDLQRYFQFYLVDKVREAMAACMDCHQRQLDGWLKETVRDAYAELGGGFAGVDVQIGEGITDISWTQVDTAAFAADYFLGGMAGADGPILLMGQAFAGFLRQRQVKGRRKEFLDAVLEQYQAVEDTVEDAVCQVYKNIKDRAVRTLEGAYEAQKERFLAAIAQARQVAGAEAGKKAEAADYLNKAAGEIEGLKGMLDRYRS